MKRASGEIGIQASTNGRRLTLDPIRTTTLADVEVREVESSLPCGFRMGWLDGTIGKEKFSLMAGAGVGSRWLIFSYGKREFIVDAENIVKALIAYADSTA